MNRRFVAAKRSRVLKADTALKLTMGSQAANAANVAEQQHGDIPCSRQKQLKLHVTVGQIKADRGKVITCEGCDCGSCKEADAKPEAGSHGINQGPCHGCLCLWLEVGSGGMGLLLYATMMGELCLCRREVSCMLM